MKATIYITGQIGGNFKLRSALSGATEIKDIMFNGFALYYQTKGDAVNAIRRAYKKLSEDFPEGKGRLGGVRATKDRTAIYYDASKAEIDTQ